MLDGSDVQGLNTTSRFFVDPLAPDCRVSHQRLLSSLPSRIIHVVFFFFFVHMPERNLQRTPPIVWFVGFLFNLLALGTNDVPGVGKEPFLGIPKQVHKKWMFYLGVIPFLISRLSKQVSCTGD